MNSAKTTPQNSDPDLTAYTAMIGDAFSTKIELLAKILKSSHYPSLGRYKERILAKTISEFLPRQFSVGTGFVLFPRKVDPDAVVSPDFDDMNMSGYELSRQCDLIIYDSFKYPTVFQDEDFVVVRPEAVRAVVEVKSSLSPKVVNEIMESCCDFCKKWKACQGFYSRNYNDPLRSILYLAMAWEIYRSPNGKATTNPKRVRNQISKFYREQFSENEFEEFPKLDRLYVYRDTEISLATSNELSTTRAKLVEGYTSFSGLGVNFDSQGKKTAPADRTIASLIAGIHWALGDGFNRFISYTEKTRNPGQYVAYKYDGFEPIFAF